MVSDRDRPYLQTAEQWARFLSALTHELRTPLASLRMLSELLAGAPPGHLGDAERRYAENIHEVAQDIQGLVLETAELAQLVAGRVQIREEMVTLRPLVEQVEEELRPRLWERGIALTDSMDPALPRHVRADRDRLRRVLGLVLGVAVSHAQSEVFFRLDLEEGSLRVLVSSDGPPFPETETREAFEPFHEGIRASRQRGGRSLALPLADELARALGGALRACNRGGRPTFDLSLPAAGSA